VEIFSENRCPSPIRVEDMLFGIMLWHLRPIAAFDLSVGLRYP